MDIEGPVFRIIVKPSSPNNKVLGYDKAKKAYKVQIKAKPEKDKANIETVKFLSRLLKRKVKIIKGFRSKQKILSFE